MLIHGNSLRKAIVNALRQALRNRLQRLRHLGHHRGAKLPRGILLQLEVEQDDGVHHQQLVELGLGVDDCRDGLVDVRGEGQRRRGDGERLVKRQVGGLVGRVGALVDVAEQLGGLDGDFDEVQGIAVEVCDGGVEAGGVAGDCAQGGEDGVWVGLGEGGGEEGEEGDELELHCCFGFWC